MKATPTGTGFRQTRLVASALVPREQLVSRAEIAAMLKVTKRTVQRYTERPDFPVPVAVLEAGRVWRRRDVAKWAKKTLPLQVGRPKREA
jgi:hypothetical protein